jgi:competence protein ComEC
MKRKLVAFLPFTAILLLALFRYLLFSGSGVECNVRIREGNEGFMSKVQLKLEDFRSTVIDRTERILPSPHAELLLGMVIGVDNFGKLPKFKQMLKDTGTIHVVVVSGFNVSLVFNMVMRLLGTRYKARNLILGLSATFVYSVVSGFDPPVVRAWIMGSLVSIGKYYGRVLDVFHVIFFTAGVLVLYDPCYLS